MVFCSNLLKDIHIPDFVLSGKLIDRVTNCKYLGHCINDALNDNDYMARQCKQNVCTGQCTDQEILHVY